MSSTLTFERQYERKITYLHHGETLAPVIQYAGELQAFSRAKISRVTVTLQSILNNNESAGEVATTDLYAKLWVKDLGSEDGATYAIIIPAPVITMFEDVPGKGKRVIKSIGQQITQYYAQFSGLTLEFRGGWLCGKGP